MGFFPKGPGANVDNVPVDNNFNIDNIIYL